MKAPLILTILASSIAILTAARADTTPSAPGGQTVKHHRTATAVRKSARPTNAEPDRIYDLASRNFIANPDYHAPARPTPVRKPTAGAEPDRIFNTITRDFEPNPDYHAPAAPTREARVKREAEPDRIFNLVTGNFEPNPAYHGR